MSDTTQDWRYMSGATAWHLIERHAETWEDIDRMMWQWLEANKKRSRPEWSAFTSDGAPILVDTPPPEAKERPTKSTPRRSQSSRRKASGTGC